MQLFARSLSGATVAVDLAAAASVEEARLALCAKEGFPEQLIRLV